MNKTQKSLTMVISGAFALSMTATQNAAENPFAFKNLSSGYQATDHNEDKMHDGKCGAGKCGAGKCGAGKCGAGKCGAQKKTHEENCIVNKTKENNCSAVKAKRKKL